MQTEQPSYLTRYVHLPALFTPSECRQIVYANLPVVQAHVVHYSGEAQDILALKQRNTKVKSMPNHADFQWVYQRVIEHIRKLNAQLFHFEILSLTDLQVLEYENTGFYNTHVDIGTGDTSRRKLSMVVFLTPPEEYEGGELILKPHFSAFTPDQGSAVVFPSYLPHEVTPVLSGVRHTLVTWVLGPCFK